MNTHQHNSSSKPISQSVPSRLATPATLGRLLSELVSGGIVVVVDSGRDSGHGAMVLASEAATEPLVAMMRRFGSGIMCVSLMEERLDALELPMMVGAHEEEGRPAFAVSVDAVDGTTTGISASDRAKTIATLVNPATRPTDLARPGHIYPVRYARSSDDELRHHADIALDLAVEGGLFPSGVSTALMNDDGSLASLEENLAFAHRHGLLVADLSTI